MHAATADAASQWRLGKILDRNRKKLTDTFNRTPDRIISLLESGVVPWQQTWSSTNQAPRNINGRNYHGVNVFLLGALHFPSPFFMTYNQANLLGGHIKKGEHGVPVVYWKMLEVSAPGEPSGKKSVPFLRYFHVFNVSQTEGVPLDKIPALPESHREHNPIQTAESIVAAMPKKPEILHGGCRACYVPSLDRVEMPAAETFRTPQDYYSVLFHELGHSTGHESRLYRKGFNGENGEWSAYGSRPYAFEELVAECCTALVCGEAGILERTLDNSASYISGWLQRLKGDSRFIVQAAGQAQRAADFILGKLQPEAPESQN
jgi:antirestriction protein ArdC